MHTTWTQTHHPRPDSARLVRAIMGQGDAGQVPFLELFADHEVIAAFLNEPLPWSSGQPWSREMERAALDQKVRFWHALGYDALWQGPGLNLRFKHTIAEDTAELTRQGREWMDEGRGLIATWEDFERYPWPKSSEADFFGMETLDRCMPEGMGILLQIGGIYETASWVMGYETFSLALYEQPNLVQAIFDRIRELFLPVLRGAVQRERVIGVWVGDDMGYKTGTLVSPKHLRQYVFPLHKEMAAITHAAGLPYMLHSCGNLAAVMDDLVNDVGIDAKHSFEDVIEPVEHFADRYAGAREGSADAMRKIAVIGGVDLDLLTRGTPEMVRTRTRQVLAACAPTRAYVLGTGNSVANYIPLENFLAMVDEGWKFNGW